MDTNIPLKLNVSQPYNEKFIRFLFCFCRSILVLGRNSFVWKPNVRTDPTLLYGAICLSTKSLCQVWFNLIQFNPIWSSLIQFDPIYSNFRMVPEKEMHKFTTCQILQLGILCAFGFNPWPYAKMIFPIVLFTFLPIRHKLIPLFLEKKYLDVLDGGD